MKRYFFDLSDGSRERDEIGTELADDVAAQHEAIRFLGEILRHEPYRLLNGTLKVDVRARHDFAGFAVHATLQTGSVSPHAD